MAESEISPLKQLSGLSKSLFKLLDEEFELLSGRDFSWSSFLVETPGPITSLKTSEYLMTLGIGIFFSQIKLLSS